MTNVSTPDQTARAILRLLVRGMRLRAGSGVVLELLDQHARAEGLESDELLEGLIHAHLQGWLVYDNERAWVGLTKAGLAVAGSRERDD